MRGAVRALPLRPLRPCKSTPCYRLTYIFGPRDMPRQATVIFGTCDCLAPCEEYLLREKRACVEWIERWGVCPYVMREDLFTSGGATEGALLASRNS